MQMHSPDVPPCPNCGERAKIEVDTTVTNLIKNKLEAIRGQLEPYLGDVPFELTYQDAQSFGCAACHAARHDVAIICTNDGVDLVVFTDKEEK